MAQKSSSSSSNAMAVVTGAAGQVAADMINKGLVAPIMKRLDDVIRMDRNNQFLQGKLERMKNLLQCISNAFENKEIKPQDNIAYCLARIRDAIKEANDLSAQAEEKQKSLHWVWYKFSISGQIAELNAKFDGLFKDLELDFSMFQKAQQMADKPLPDAFLQPVQNGDFVGLGFENTKTQLHTWIEKAPQVQVIGVYGMPGVGKTLLLKEAYNFYKVKSFDEASKDSDEARKHFDVVIWLTVSQHYEISALQDRIGKSINLNFSTADNKDTKKGALSANLKNKKFLLILDDLWRALDLEELGVASLTHKGSKVVFSTRDRGIALTEADESTEVELLSREDGWLLFERVAFRGSHVQDEIMECAKKIAEECKCLPLAITVVAKAMRAKKTPGEWNTSLSQMKHPSFPHTHPSVDEELYKKLRWSYDDLARTPNLQLCFLYCAMYPEDEKIWVDELVRIWIAEGFVEDMQHGHSYVKLLIDRGLFQSVNLEKQVMDILVNKPVNVWKKRFITVHDVIRDVAINIGEQQKNHYCRAGSQLQSFTDSQHWQRVSVRRNQIESVPEDILSTQLVSLILSTNPLTCNVQGTFLNNLNSLKVLDLSNTQIESPPTSLTQLGVLDLSNTKINSVPTSFTRLKFLTLRGTCIKELPSQIGNLSALQFLDISECKYLTSLPEGISKLTSLRRLHLSMGMANAVTDPENVRALTGLKNLTELHLYMFFKFEDNGIMGTIMSSWVQMRHLYLHYNHMIPSKSNLPEGMQNMANLQTLVLYDYRGTKLPNWICKFQQLERLELDSCENVKELPPLEDLPCLKFLKLRKYSSVRNLEIRSRGFPKLEMLHLSDMPKMRSIDVLVEEALPKLRVLKIKKCPLLRKLPKGLEKLPDFKAIYGHKISWWEKIPWEEKIYLHKLFREI